MDPNGRHIICEAHQENPEVANSCVVPSENAMLENDSTTYGSEPGIVIGGKTSEEARQENEMSSVRIHCLRKKS